ncbi:hypothetical protein CLU96_2348 [Chryseobacterium sp. 52]|nr:hypothetical protein CLU96_2348 [Chryseobacterium sp. 52]
MLWKFYCKIGVNAFSKITNRIMAASVFKNMVVFSHGMIDRIGIHMFDLENDKILIVFNFYQIFRYFGINKFRFFKIVGKQNKGY